MLDNWKFWIIICALVVLMAVLIALALIVRLWKPYISSSELLQDCWLQLCFCQHYFGFHY